MVYLQLLREYGERHAVRWWGYCLMSNHVHLVAVPMKENALAKRYAWRIPITPAMRT
jgi:putative transposase